MYKEFVSLVKELYKDETFVPLHAPKFLGNEKKYLNECVDSTFVSSVGEFVNRFEKAVQNYTGASFAIAISNGTSALHVALHAIGVKQDDEVITQSLSFVATTNAISYCGAKPIFLDIDQKTYGLSATQLENFLTNNCEVVDSTCRNKKSRKTIKACVPMHSFGHPCEIEKIKTICDKYHISLIEDAAESLGSFYNNKHTGRFGKAGIISFNGNKTITAGGGGVIITDDEKLAKRLKHLTTTAKIPHPYEYDHDEIGFNYRMPNINAALVLAGIERLDEILKNKKETYEKYEKFFTCRGIELLKEPKNSTSNYWLNTILLKESKDKKELLEICTKENIMVRPVWKPLHTLNMYKGCQCENMTNTLKFYDKALNIPSGER
jgi:aminotransferase in exopolysaccharide biosynthesis